MHLKSEIVLDLSIMTKVELVTEWEWRFDEKIYCEVDHEGERIAQSHREAGRMSVPSAASSAGARRCNFWV